MTTDLLPCPFCGPSHIYAYTRDGTDQTVAIRCNSCGATTADFKSDPATFSGEPDAIAAWNRRASPSAAEVQALVERTDELLHSIEGWGKAYPTDIFHEPTKEERDWLHATRPGLMDCIAASMGRHVWSHIEKDVAAIRDELAKLIPRGK